MKATQRLRPKRPLTRNTASSLMLPNCVPLRIPACVNKRRRECRLRRSASVRGFGCRPFPNACLRATLGPASESLQRRKPRVGRAPIRRRELWGFESRRRLLTSGRNGDRRRFRRIEGSQGMLSAGAGMMFFAAAVLGRVGRRTIGRAPAARSNDPQQKRGELRRCG